MRLVGLSGRARSRRYDAREAKPSRHELVVMEELIDGPQVGHHANTRAARPSLSCPTESDRRTTAQVDPTRDLAAGLTLPASDLTCQVISNAAASSSL